MAAELPGVKIGLKKLAGVLFDDIGDHLKTSGKWPLVIDETGQAATFLKYRDCNCLNTLEKIDMEPERLRKALIGSLRFGKPFVIDMMDADMFQLVTERLDEIQKGLMDSILDRSILNEDKYMSLVKPNDGEEYRGPLAYLVDNFKFFIITTLPLPSDVLLKKFCAIRVTA